MTALKKFLEQEALEIMSVDNKLEDIEVEKSLKLLNDCIDNSAKLVISGVGKSGIIARKIAATFSSIGLMSIYLNPLDALHGDLGLVKPKDICLLISNSGETSELIQLLPHIKKRLVPIIALIGKANCSLSRNCDVLLKASIDKEVCPLNLAPTSSTSVSMAIGDALAAELMQRRKISSCDFALNHPAGSLGKKLVLVASDLMVPIEKFNPLKKDSPLIEVISALTTNGMGVGLVEKSNQKGSILGLITDGDLRRGLKKYPKEKWVALKASDLMTSDPITIKENSLAIEALKLMEQNIKKQVSILPVISSKDFSISGVLRLHDLIQAGFS